MYYGRLGYSKNHPEYDATKLAHPVHVTDWKRVSVNPIHADGQYVGLPEGRWETVKSDTSISVPDA